ncbi:hypothetical protein BEP68_03605 [Microbacterium sp. 4-7]|uniref:MFS transporter n=1 Tax=Microbacterium foliorum TaxID=104336 RepID=UPI0021C71907|nr:hypothetical protein [Microbacterium sp. 4-7]
MGDVSESVGSSSSLRRNRSFQRLVVAKVSNELSSAIGNVALPLIVLGMTASATLAGLVLFVSNAALIATQALGGALVDRHPPSLVLRLSSFAQAFGWALALTAILLPDAKFLPLLLLGAALAGGASGLDGPSEQALVKVIVPRDQLGWAAAVSQGREAGAGLIGGPVGGLLFSAGTVWALGAQIALNVVAGIFTPRSSSRATDLQPQSGYVVQLRDGFAFVWRQRGLRGVAIVAGLANLPIIVLPLTLIAYYQTRGEAPVAIGILATAFGAGVVAGALLAGPVSSRFRLGRLGSIALAAFALGQAAVVLTYPSLPITAAILLLSALPLPAFNAAISAYTVTVTPAPLMGRVTAASGVPGMLLMPVGALGGGLLFDHYGPVVPLVLSAMVAIATVVVMVSSSDLRLIPRLADLGEVVHEAPD